MIFYLVKWVKDGKYAVISSVMFVNDQGFVNAKEAKIVFEKGELKYESRKVKIWKDNKKASIVMLTNNFEFSVEDLRDIYRRRQIISEGHLKSTPIIVRYSLMFE